VTASTVAPSPAPVVVVQDPGPDGVEIAGLVFAILGFAVGATASVVSIVLAWRAVKIGRQANDAAVKAAQEAERANEEASKARAAVAAERRRTFELEVLRDLLVAIDGEWGTAKKIANSPTAVSRFTGRLHLLPNDLPTWRKVWRTTPRNLFGVAKVVGVEDESAAQIEQGGKEVASTRLVSVLHLALVDDVHVAIKRRMDARDD
jgi:hypothetical protein